MEKYSRGRRGAPAKGVGRATGARVQISPSPPQKSKHRLMLAFLCEKEFELERREPARGVRGLPLPVADEGRPQNWQKPNELEYALACDK